MIELIKKIERIIIIFLIVMMTIVLMFASIDLGWYIIKDVSKHPYYLLDINDLLEIFGLFLLVLIGIELLETIKIYLIEKVIRVEVVLIVGIIAITRKVVISPIIWRAIICVESKL